MGRKTCVRPLSHTSPDIAHARSEYCCCCFSAPYCRRCQNLLGPVNKTQRGETCTLLKVAVHWLRGEQEEYRKETLERRRQVEESGGSDAIRNRNPNLKACTCRKFSLVACSMLSLLSNGMSATRAQSRLLRSCLSTEACFAHVACR